MKVIVDRNLCIGAASCVALAMKTFVLDAEGKAEVINVEGKEQTTEFSIGMTTAMNDEREMVIEAARSCPVNAIQLIDDDGTQLV